MINSKVKNIEDGKLVNCGLFESLTQAHDYNLENFIPNENYEFKYFEANKDGSDGEEVVPS